METTHHTKSHWLAKRLPFFYGWIILPISILATVLTSPGQTFMVSVFNPSFRTELGLSLSELTGAYMLGTITASIAQPFIGAWIDKLGIRKVLLFVVTVFSLACIFISQADSLLMLFFGFLFLRMFGQGALELISVNMLPMWFRKPLGKISGFRNVLVNLLISLIPVGVLALISSIGWRSTYIAAGIFIFAVLFPTAWFFMVNRPEDVGQSLDGENTAAKSAEPEEKIIFKNSFTLKQAMRTRSYWIFAASWFSWAAIGTAITFNLLPIFTAKGLTETQAAATFSILMVVSAFCQILGGFLADRFKAQSMAFFAFLLYASAVICLILLPQSSVVLVYTLLLGLAQGLFGGLGTTVWVRYYGRQNLGKIRGSIWTAGVAGSSIGPFLMGLSFDQTGSFITSLWVVVGCLAILAVANLWSSKPILPEPLESTQ